MFIHSDTWVKPFFDGVDTQGIDIPVWDGAAYVTYPNFNWVYNKINLMKSQNVPAYPHGVTPTNFPVFSKPITNLWGMSIGAKRLDDWEEEYYQPGHFWMPYLEGRHLSIDTILINGEFYQAFTTEGIKDENSSFVYWDTCIELPDSTLATIQTWSRDYLSPFTGVVNFEMIGNKIIECHLRMSDQFIELYGEGWLKKVVNLYKHHIWNFHETQPGFSYVVRTAEPGIYKVTGNYWEQVKHLVSSVRITLPKDGDVTNEANDEFSYVLAHVNGFNFDNCKQAAEIVKSSLSLISD